MMYGLELIRNPSQSADADSSPSGGAEPVETSLAPLPLPLGEVSAPALTERAANEVSALRQDVAELRAMLVAQNSLLEQVAQALSQTRVSRGQERALHQAVRDRAVFLREREGLPAPAGRKISAAILVTVRQLTGCRALGDVPAIKFDNVMSAIQAWDMAGALRKIRRGLNAQ